MDPQRLFWVAVIAISAIFAANICLDQWNRYQTNPTVLSLDTSYRNWVFRLPGITMCSNYTSNVTTSEVVEQLFSVQKDDSDYRLYESYVEIVALTRYYNLHEFSAFLNETKRFSGVSMLDIAREVSAQRFNCHRTR